LSSLRSAAERQRSRSSCSPTIGGTMSAAAASAIGWRTECVKFPEEM
jgi:hypothetical protein